MVPICGTCKIKRYRTCWKSIQEPGNDIPDLVDLENLGSASGGAEDNNLISLSNGSELSNGFNCEPDEPGLYDDNNMGIFDTNLSLERYLEEHFNEVVENISKSKMELCANNTIHSFSDEEWSNDLKISRSLYSGINFSLDDQGIRFLEFFKNKVSALITVGPQSSNYLLKTLIPLASNSEPIQYALASWGGMFIDGKPNIHNYQVYMVKASKLILMKYNMSTEFSKNDFFVVLCFFLIAMSIEICSGDTLRWKNFLEQCKHLVIKQGGIIKILHNFNFSNDIKWMISNLQFHDILSSDTYLNGSILMDEYKTVFKTGKLLETDNYGIDPYQGCNQPIYLLLGDIVNENIIIKQKKKQLEADLFKIQSQEPSSLNEHSNSFNAKLRIKYYEYVNTRVKGLREEVEKCQPHEIRVSLDLTQNDLEAHLALFSLIKYACELLLLQIESIPPSSNRLQTILIHALDHIDRIIDTRMIPCLGFPLLMCAIVAYKEEDQVTMRRQIERLMQTYFVGNMEKIYCVINEAWKINKEGNLCIDWAEIAKGKGWLLFSC